MSSFAGFAPQPEVSQNTSLATLLHRADELARQFNRHHASSLNSVSSLPSLANQLQNLMSMPSIPVTRSRPEGGMRERGMAKVQQTVEEFLQGVRDDLGKMERDVEQLNALLFEADLFLATPSLALQHGLNPKEALQHVSGLFAQYQAELIRLREVLADFTSEQIGVDEFVDEWKTMKEVDKGQEAELSDLVDVLGSWGASGGLDVEMS
ncbi:leucine-rich repeat extensin-like protein 5 [Rhodotorula toruloides]|uniref:Leucine-rich repeat extensin-like protein 5 n=1 Tax=Rhodotorula toruloides TaxID=5286 RepID=A0A511KP08_RHOTO|nr:leucine-rich repeat extensin-like protein 5 [Rhodotorula toruloides]